MLPEARRPMPHASSAPVYNIDVSGRLLRDSCWLEVPELHFEKFIAKGANGAIFLAKELRLKREVAVKIWNEPLTRRQHRALGEAQKLANIRHHNSSLSSRSPRSRGLHTLSCNTSRAKRSSPGC